MAENLMDFDDAKLVRFHCSCMSPMHSLDVVFENWDVGKETDVLVEFNSKYEPKRIRDRLVRAFRILRGKEIFDHDFCFRAKDTEALIEALQKYASAAEEGSKTI